MKSLSVKFVLITVLLQLCLSVHEVSAGGVISRVLAGLSALIRPREPVGVEFENENDLRFGDLLVITTKFNHYAVYVGRKHLPGKTDDNQTIFEMMKDPDGCRFHTADAPFRRHNYFDQDAKPGGERLEPQSEDDMKRTIERLRNDPVCQTYNVVTRNCELIATKVRYGESHCNQLGHIVEPLARFIPAGWIKRRESSAAA